MAKILIVEDGAGLRENLTILLSRNGHVVRAASEGREALRMITTEIPDLIITDLYMPEKDGIEIIQEVRRLYPQTRLIAMSGGIHGDSGTLLQMAKRLGVDATLSKPCSIQDILATVNSVLGKSA